MNSADTRIFGTRPSNVRIEEDDARRKREAEERERAALAARHVIQMCTVCGAALPMGDVHTCKGGAMRAAL